MVWTLELHLIVWSAGPFQGEYTEWWTVVVSGDWRVDIFSGSHHQSQLKSDEWNWLLNLMMTSAQVVKALVITTVNIPGIFSPRRLDFAITFKPLILLWNSLFFLLSISWRQKKVLAEWLTVTRNFHSDLDLRTDPLTAWLTDQL